MEPTQDPHERSLLILYATETGTAQDAADRVARECRRIHFSARVVDMGSYDAVCIPPKIRNGPSLTFASGRINLHTPRDLHRVDDGRGDRATHDDNAVEPAPSV